jgi:hypothetical protein
VQIYGSARACWSETNESEKDTITTRYVGREIYLDTKTYLFGHGAETQELPAGIHRYNFSCQLPHMLPETIKVANGEIEYHVEAFLDVPWHSILSFDRKAIIPFTVVRNDDLNFYPELKLPQNREEVKTFCCLHCQSGIASLFLKVIL